MNLSDLGHFIEVNSKIISCKGTGPGQFAVDKASISDACFFNETWEILESHGRIYVWIPSVVVRRYFDVTATGHWRGHSVIAQESELDGFVLVSPTSDTPPNLAAEDFEGDQYMGWTKLIRADELEDVEIHINDYPVDDMR